MTAYAIIISTADLEIIARDEFDDAITYHAKTDRYFYGTIEGNELVRPVISYDNVRFTDTGRDDKRAVEFFNEKLGFEA